MLVVNKKKQEDYTHHCGCDTGTGPEEHAIMHAQCDTHGGVLYSSHDEIHLVKDTCVRQSTEESCGSGGAGCILSVECKDGTQPQVNFGCEWYENHW